MSTDAFEEFVVGHGELWNAQLLALKLRSLGATHAAFMDTRDVVVVAPTQDGNSVDLQYEVRAGGWGDRARSTCSTK
jgi:aspartokinase/homoserine dehydrogenase 1